MSAINYIAAIEALSAPPVHHEMLKAHNAFASAGWEYQNPTEHTQYNGKEILVAVFHGGELLLWIEGETPRVWRGGNRPGPRTRGPQFSHYRARRPGSLPRSTESKGLLSFGLTTGIKLCIIIPG